VTYGSPPAVSNADHALGVYVDLAQLETPARDQFFTQLDAAGVDWVRMPLAWQDLQQAASSNNWAAIDSAVNGATAHKVRVLALIKDRIVTGSKPGTPPADIAGFGRAIRAAAERYRGRISAYQIWDEPNIAAGWGGQFPDPVVYARILRESYIQIHAADSEAVVVSAALSPTTENGPLNLNEPEYLRQLYRIGARDAFDVLGAEPFGFWSGPDDRRVDPNVLNFSRLILLRDIMQANGDGGKAIWATAFGWYTLANGGDSPFGGDNATKQSARTLDAIQRARDEWPWLGPLFSPRWIPEGPADSRAGFALLQSDGLSTALLDQLHARRSDVKTATIGRYAANDASGVYGSGWRITAEAADPAQSTVSPIHITFRGTRIDLSVRRGLFEGFLFVTIDGRPANALPGDEQGRSYVVLFDPLGLPDEMTLARELSDGEHLAELTPQGGWGQWAITGWIVERERQPTWTWMLGGAGAGLLILALSHHVRGSNDLWRRVVVAPIRVKFSLSTAAWTRVAYTLTLGAGALLYVSPSLILSWVLIALLAMLIAWRLETGLALVALAAPFYLQPKALGVGSYSVVELSLLLCVASTVLRVLPRLRYQWVCTLITLPERLRPASLSLTDVAVLLWVVAGTLGVLIAENFGVASREFRVVFIEPAIYYALLRYTRTQVWPLVNAFLLGAVLVSTKGLVDWMQHSDLITAEGVVQVRSVYASPNNLALYLDRAVPLALALGLFGRGYRWAYFAAFALMLAVLYLTFVKGAWLLAIPAAVLWIAAMRGRRFFAGAIAMLAVLVISLVPVLGTARIQSLFNLTNGTSFIRVQLWQATLAMIRDHPVFGVGPDNFLYQYRTRYILPTAFTDAGLSHPHNIVLDFWTRLGLLGLLVAALMLVGFWREALALYRRLPEGDMRALAMGLMAAMAASLAHGLIDNSFFLVDLAFVLMLMLAAIQILSQQGDRLAKPQNHQE
jgi:O-antigen ligase